MPGGVRLPPGDVHGCRAVGVNCSLENEQLTPENEGVPQAPELVLDEALRLLGASTDGHLLTAPDGRQFDLVMREAKVVTPTVARTLTRGRRPPARVSVVIGDLIGEAARQALRDAGWGWLDRRGHLRLLAEGIWVETAVPPMPRPGTGSGLGESVRGTSGIAVAAAHLIHPDDPPGVRELARRVGLSAAAISTARRRLVDAGLLARNGEPAVPDLFWALASVWRSSRRGLARVPKTDGLAVTGTHAAVALGAPLAATGHYPVHLLAADERAFQRARLLGGEATSTPAATLTLAPTPLALDAEIMGPTTVEGLPTVHPLFVALELADDPGRGSEALDQWTPHGVVRVW